MNTWGTLQSILAVLGAVTIFILAVAGLILAIKRKASEQALEEWQTLAAARLETIHQERNEKEHAQRELSTIQTHLGECERLRNDFAAHNLRLNARLTNYERCINRLERDLGRQPTNFDDPFKDSRG
jgi:septal ring factor EnvC (AmiA/AmiB activator)